MKGTTIALIIAAVVIVLILVIVIGIYLYNLYDKAKSEQRAEMVAAESNTMSNEEKIKSLTKSKAFKDM